MPGPPKQFDRTKALATSMEVFWRRGYDGTSIQNLVDALGINRSSLYATFGDKDALFIEALQLYIDCHLGEVMGQLHGPGSPLKRIEAMIRLGLAKNREMGNPGCLAANSIAELGSGHERAAELLRSAHQRVQRQVAMVLDQAAEAGELAPGTDTGAMATFIATSLHGVAVMVQVNTDAAEQTADGLIRLLRSNAFSPATG